MSPAMAPAATKAVSRRFQPPPAMIVVCSVIGMVLAIGSMTLPVSLSATRRWVASSESKVRDSPRAGAASGAGVSSSAGASARRSARGRRS